MRLEDLADGALDEVLAALGVERVDIPHGCAIPGSYWGDSEAGLIGAQLFVRHDTPVHSALHEACHFFCAAAERRTGLHTHAGGDDIEEVAVCYLQVLLADRVEGYSSGQLLRDMDAWGYSFRLGSARAWFESDSEDARAWLESRGIM